MVRGTALGCRFTQETTLWNGLDRIEFRTHLDGFAGEDTLFRVRFPVDVEGAMPVSGVAGAVVGRTFGFPSVDVAEVPFTLDYPAYDWFGLSRCLRSSWARIGAGHLGRRGGDARRGRLGRARRRIGRGAGQPGGDIHRLDG